MYSNDLVSVKVPRLAIKQVRRLKAKLMLARDKRISDAEVIGEALAFTARHEREFVGKKKTLCLMDMAGSIKGGGKFNAVDEIDKIVYGV